MITNYRIFRVLKMHFTNKTNLTNSYTKYKIELSFSNNSIHYVL